MKLITDEDYLHLHELYLVATSDNPADGMPYPLRQLMKRFILEQLYENDVNIKTLKEMFGVETKSLKYTTGAQLASLNVLYYLYETSKASKVDNNTLGELASFILEEAYIHGVDLRSMKIAGEIYHKKQLVAEANN